jgi:RNA polymerase sigma-70 factor, ECF subfamily
VVRTTVAQIYEQHAGFVWRTLRRLGVPQDDVADAMQDVFLTVHRSLDAFEGRCSVPTWIFTICRSVARDRRRRAYLRYEVSGDCAIEREVDLRADVGARAEQHEQLSLLESILAGLPPDQRTVFVLFEIEAMTGEEISEALAVPLGTVYSRLGLARTAFRRSLARLSAKDDPARPVHAGGKP